MLTPTYMDHKSKRELYLRNQLTCCIWMNLAMEIQEPEHKEHKYLSSNIISLFGSQENYWDKGKKFIFWRYVTTHLGYGITASSRKLLVNFFAFDFATTKESGKKTRHWSQSNQYCWYLSQICFQSSKIFSRSR